MIKSGHQPKALFEAATAEKAFATLRSILNEAIVQDYLVSS
jgi:hypothetical protein